MEVITSPIEPQGIKFSLLSDNQEIGHAFLYLLSNELHAAPFGLLEDLQVKEQYRGQGYGTKLVQVVMAEAKKQHCYKLICTSRYSREQVHKMYEKLGFKDYGKEFRMDL